MKRKKIFAISVAFVVLIAAAFVHYYNPFARSVDSIISRQFATMRGAKLGQEEMMMTQLTNAQVNKKWSFRWKILEDEMRKKGASDAEIKGVIATAHKHFSSQSYDSSYTYGVPVGVTRVWYRFQPIWIIKFGWGMGSDNQGDITEGPSHRRVLGISARKPYKLLGMQTCG